MNHRTMESLNHGTIERKISNRSRMWSAAGHQPAADHDKNTDFVRILLCFHGVTEEIEGSKPPFGLLLRVEEHTTRHQNGMGKRLTLSLIYDKCMQQ